MNTIHSRIDQGWHLDEAVEFWETHDSADYWAELEEVTFDVDLHQNLLHPRLVILTHRPERCPRCQRELEEVTIESVLWNKGHLWVFRDVPALRCLNGHEYILEKTIDRIEYLLNPEKTQQVQPTDMIRVPVFSLRLSI